MKSKSENVPAPGPLETHSRQDWINWKKHFLTYVYDANILPIHQGNQLFEHIGRIGLEISENFYFRDSKSKTDIETLLFKFDVYYIFCGRKRHNDESIDDYLNALKVWFFNLFKLSIQISYFGKVMI